MNKNLNKKEEKIPVYLIDVQNIVPYNIFNIRRNDMIAVNYSQFREKMKYYMDMASEEEEVIVITRKNSNAILISEAEFNNLLENMYINSDPENIRWIDESSKQIEEGKLHFYELKEE